MMSKRLVLVLAVALPALGACGGAAAIDPGAAESLQQQVRELATVTQEGNLALAGERATALKTEVQQAQDTGAVTAGRAGRIQSNIDAFIASIQPAETPEPVAPTVEPAPPERTFTAPGNGVKEDSRDPGETQSDREREAAEEAAEEAEEAAEEAQKRAEKEEKEKQKQKEEDREDD